MFCCEATFCSWGKLFELDSPDMIEKLFDRLPCKLEADFVSISQKNEATVSSNFSELRKLLGQAACNAKSFLGQHMLTKKESQRNITLSVLPRKYNVATAKSASDKVDATKLVKCP